MPSYFENFPKIYYDAVGKGDYKLVTNLLRRVQIKEGLSETAALFDLYDIGGEDTPESVSEQFYGDQRYYWIILLFNKTEHLRLTPSPPIIPQDYLHQQLMRKLL